MTTFTAGGGSVLSIIRYGRNEMDHHEHQMDANSDDIEPGMALERVNDGGDTRVQPNSTTADDTAQTFVALEADERGMQADLEGGDQDPYVVGVNDLVPYVRASGGGLHVLVAAGDDLGTSSEANIEVGDKIVTAGGADAGTYKAYDSNNDNADAIVFEAEESVDNSGAASGETAFLEVTPA